MVNPEELHNKAKGTDPRTSPEHVNPGTSPTPFVSMENRKSGQVPGAKVGALKTKAENPNQV